MINEYKTTLKFHRSQNFFNTVHDPKVVHFLIEKNVPLWESVSLWENVLFLDLFGSPKFWTILFLDYFTALPIIENYPINEWYIISFVSFLGAYAK